MSFRNFIGNPIVVDTLKLQLERECLPHSLLFCGIQGIGKAKLAQVLAKALNCQKMKVDSCDDCLSCAKIDQGMHPDVRWFQPDGQFLKIGQMRELSREAFYRPFEGRYRVFVIDEAERMNQEAANSILKSLEEPPPSSVFVLLTSKPDQMLPTIRSRCQLFQFHPIPFEEIEKVLLSRGEFSHRDRSLVARIGGGSIGKALSFDLPAYKERRQQSLALLEACINNFSYVAVLKELGMILDKRKLDSFEEKMQILSCLLRDAYLLKLDPTSPFIINLDITEELGRFSASASLECILRAMTVLNHLEKGAARNINKGLALDQFVFELSGEYSGLNDKFFW